MDNNKSNVLSFDDKVEIIKEFYKETQKIDVSVIIPKEEKELFLIIDANGKTVNASFSLDEIINSFEKEENTSSVSNSGSSSNNTSSQTSKVRARDTRKMVMDTTINMSLSGIMGVIQDLATMNDEISNYSLNYSSCLSGELAAYYNTLNDTTKENILKLSNIISSLSIATETSLSLCYETSNMSLKELEELINDLYNQSDEEFVLKDEEFDEEEFEQLLLKVAYKDQMELPKEVILNIINSNENLTEEDKKYINEQLEKGNIRSSIGYLMQLNEQQKLDKIHEKNDSQIASLNDEISELNKKLAIIDNPTNAKRVYPDPNIDYGVLYKERIEKQAELKKLQREIKEQEKVVRQYSNSKKEWEYDYLLKDMPDKYSGKDIDLLYQSNWSSNPMADQISDLEYKGYKYFDDDHKKLYYYLYENEGKDAANKYLEAFSDSLNKASGMEKATNIFNNIANGTNKGYVLGLGVANLEGIEIGTEKWFDTVGTIFDNSGNLTDSEYAIQYVNQMLSGTSMLLTLNESDLKTLGGNLDNESYNDLVNKIHNGETITYADLKYQQGELSQSEYDVIKDLKDDSEVLKFVDKINDGSSFLGKDKANWLNTMFNAGVSTGNMVPSMVASFATSGALGSLGVGTELAGNIGQKVGLSLMFLGSFADSKNQSIRDGRSVFDSYVYGMLSGASEMFTEKFLGFVPGISNVHKWTELTPTSKTSHTIMKSLLNFLVTGPLGEITEEELQQWVIEPTIEEIVDGYSDTEFDINEALELALETYISTLEMNSVSIIPQTKGAIKASSEIVSVTLSDGSIVKLTAGQLMDCMNKKTGEIDVSKIKQIVGKKFSEEVSNEHIPVNVQSDSNLYNIEKIKNGEELTIADKLDLDGRDHVVREIDGYELKPDHAYRLIDLKAWEDYVKNGKVVGDKEEYVNGENNGGVDWYLGGFANPTGRYSSGDGTIILETPADKSLFVLAGDNGLGTAYDYHIRHLKSSSRENPVPLGKVKVIFGQEAIARWTQLQINAKKEKLQSLADARGIEVKDFANIGKNDVYTKEEIAKAHNHAINIHEQAVKNEPEITAVMHSFEDENSYLIGLKHKLKDEDSIERKVLFDHHHAGIEIDEAAKRIGDSVRYTMIIDEDHYTGKAQETLKSLVSKGYQIRDNGARNSWGNGLYKGLNCSIITPNGITFELQFHTETSFDVKEDKTHQVYEIRRNEAIRKGTDDLSEVREAVTEIQRLYTSTIPIPKDVIGHDFMKGAYE